MEYFCKAGHLYDGGRTLCKECLAERNREWLEDRSRFVTKSRRKRAFSVKRVQSIQNDAEGSTIFRNYMARARIVSIGVKEKDKLDNFTHPDILSLLKSQRNCCRGCLTPFTDVAYEVDHKISLQYGGSNHPSNLQLLCSDCNASKGNRDNDEWISSVRTRQVVEYLMELEEEYSYGD